jgi:hypothetical protein
MGLHFQNENGYNGYMDITLFYYNGYMDITLFFEGPNVNEIISYFGHL